MTCLFPKCVNGCQGHYATHPPTPPWRTLCTPANVTLLPVRPEYQRPISGYSREAYFT